MKFWGWGRKSMQEGDKGKISHEKGSVLLVGKECDIGEVGCRFPPQFKRSSHIFGCASLYGVSYRDKFTCISFAY